jgi:hypothetical protein
MLLSLLLLLHSPRKVSFDDDSFAAQAATVFSTLGDDHRCAETSRFSKSIYFSSAPPSPALSITLFGRTTQPLGPVLKERIGETKEREPRSKLETWPTLDRTAVQKPGGGVTIIFLFVFGRVQHRNPRQRRCPVNRGPAAHLSDDHKKHRSKGHTVTLRVSWAVDVAKT